MVIKIFYFVISIFSVAMVYLTIQDPYHSDFLKPDKNIANMRMGNVVDYEINSTLISGRYEAQSWNRYSDRDEFVMFKAQILKDDLEHNLSSINAMHKSNVFLFKNNVNYINSDRVNFKSEEAKYDINKKILSSTVPFVITQNSDKITGNNVTYDVNSKKIYAKGIKAWIEEKR
ncbi:LPS export ABC transporter periplasmic protein LptC [Campylobacter sp. MOP7]|uniref:LPS export ABC transporter periplasmic protein LptC n=1 Tax=Campylobacter canis TaxID=3378588 RepID=UPI00387EB9B9